jgi:uncharacterized protein (TIGR04255 family)
MYATEERSEVARFQQSLDGSFIAEAPVTPRSAAALGATPLPARHAPSQETVWPFRNPEREWTVSLSSTSLALEAGRYLDFDDFAAELERILTALHDVFAPRQELRLGLRYINRIEDEQLKKRSISFFINEELARPVGGPLGTNLLSSINELRFRERESTVVLRHGLIDEAVYLLDFDHFSDERRDFDPAAIVRRIQKFHALIERLFVWSLSGRYLKQLQKGKR